jgi:uncharacterized protein with NRDE domain
MNKYERLKKDLEERGEGKMTCFGNSMTPILQSGCTLTFKKQDTYDIGDIVFSKVKGRYIDAHKITKKGEDGRYLISNNHGFDNGWTKIIYGRAVLAEYSNKKSKEL